MNNIKYEQALGTAMETLGVEMKELRGGRRDTKVVDARSIIAALLKEQCGMLQVEIAELLGVTQVAVSKMLTRHRLMMLYNTPYKKKWAKVNE